MQGLVRLILKFLLSAGALILVAYIVPGIHIGHIAAIVAAVVLGILNAVIRPGLVILTLPFTILTLGLFLFVINAVLFWLAALIVPHFTIHGVGAALFGSILYGLLGWLINLVVHRVKL